MKALITGIDGQDGFYLSEFLESIGYQVYGFGEDWADNVPVYLDRLKKHPVDEIYNLAALTNSDDVAETFRTNTIQAIDLMEFAKETNTKLFQASSALQNSLSPYGVSKLAAHRMAEYYRIIEGAFIVSGVMHNHVSPRSKGTVINKICDYVKNFDKQTEPLTLANLDSIRDYGHAKDYVRAMWISMQERSPRTYEFATGFTHTVEDIASEAFTAKGINDWRSFINVDESTVKAGSPHCIVRHDIESGLVSTFDIRDFDWEPIFDLKCIVRELLL